MYTDECVRVQVVQPQQLGGKTFYHTIIDETDIQGDFLFDPYIFCFDCWDHTYDSLREEVEGMPPIEDEASAHSCSCCGSGIRDWEYAGTFSVGEFRVSKRAPNGIHGPHFHTDIRPSVLCLYCLGVLNENYIALWDNLSQFDECLDCIQVRCWRFPNCGCGCHNESPEDRTDNDEDDDDDY